METQLNAYYKTPQGVKFVTVFGYATKGVPTLEINGAGKMAKNIKEKIIYLTRTRNLKIPLRRFVICVDINELNDQNNYSLKWLEFPILVMYWYLCGFIPISKLDDCLCSGWIRVKGEIHHMPPPMNMRELLQEHFTAKERERLKMISTIGADYGDLYTIESKLLLEHIPELDFKVDYMQSVSSRAELRSVVNS